MATNTTNYNLKKPAQDDFYDVDDFNNNADIIDTQMKANAGKADAALPASDFTGANVLTKLAADNSVLPVKSGGTEANTAKDGLANLLGLSKLTAASTAVDYADTSTDGVMLVSLSSTNHAELYALLGGSYAYIIQIFYLATDSSRSRMQLAHGYLNNIMATRNYDGNTGTWSSWQKVYTDVDVIPVKNGGTGANAANAARDNLGAFRKVAAYDPGGNTNLDTTTYELVVAAITSTVNPELHALMPNDTFVFVTQYFYSVQSASTRRVQVAHSYSNLIAVRVYSTKWGEWQPVITGDNVAAQVQSLLTGGEISVIKSIQRGTISLAGVYSATATISSVDTSKSVISYLGNVVPEYADQFARVELTNSTTITAYRNSNNANSTVVGFEVVEYY
ncbi:MAG: hypothetical protein LKJ75_02610 [Clostridia bacterium]|jgi:hypothetical protein|nr:hypothetical protein [Clostridia bacterium]MCI2014076.1 hypothetical protein [Clostridia bacterium]